MMQVGPSSLLGIAGAPDVREASEIAGAFQTPEQAAQFASMLAALVAPPERAPDAPDDTTPLSELDAPDAESVDEEASDRVAEPSSTATSASAATPSSAESLVAASRAMAASVAASLEPVRSPGALEPEFREKLTRVVERMRELGHEVRIVETVRSQARQDKLFAQGRSEEGPVVTWTRRSRHTEGLAADVLIDGKYDGPGYRTLHRLAAEEGLRTLGARDPGHVELPRAQTVAPRGTPSGAAPIDTPPGRMLESLEALSTLGARVERSTVAPVAQVAGVARVAQVAEVAHVAPVGQLAAPREIAPGGEPARAASNRRMRSESIESTGGPTRPAAAALARDLVRTVTRRRATDDGAEVGAGRDESAARLDQLAQALGRSSGLAASGERAGAIETLARTVGGSQLDQVHRVLAAQDAARGRPITELSLALDAPESGVDRIHLGVSGRRVGATIEAIDDASATRIGGRLDELTRALGRAGLEPDAVRIAGPEARDVARDLGGRTMQPLEAGRGASTPGHDRQQDDTSRGGEAWTQEDRRQQSGGRHRSRRDQQETTQ